MYEFAGRFNREDLLLKEFNYWILILRPYRKLFFLKEVVHL